VSDNPAPLGWELRAQKRGRRAQAWIRRRRVLVVAITLVAIVAVAGGAVWALQSNPPHTSLAGVVKPPSDPASTLAPAPRDACRSPLEPDHPLRVWIGGDSLAYLFGASLSKRLANTGIVEPTYDSRPSSGLTSPEFFDWPSHAKEEMQRVDPEIVVFIIGTNDFSVPQPRPVDDHGDPAWRAFYSLLVKQMLDIFGSNERPVYWIGGPTLKDQRKDDGVRQINDVARDVVSSRHGDTYIDAYQLFSDPKDGGYTPTLPGFNGANVRVRTSDGIHFTESGANYLAARVFEHLDHRCRLNEQAVPSAHQTVHQTPGSGKMPGTSSSSSSSTSGTSPPTSPPPTPPPTPPTTAPPSTILPPISLIPG